MVSKNSHDAEDLAQPALEQPIRAFPGSSAAQVPIHPLPVPINGLNAAALDLEVCQPLVYEGHQRNDRRLRSLSGQRLKRALRQIGKGVAVRGDLVS